MRDIDSLRDDQWERLKELVPGGRAGERGPRCDNRRFVDALLWMARSGGRWRDLPERFGDHQAVVLLSVIRKLFILRRKRWSTTLTATVAASCKADFCRTPLGT